MMKYPVFSRKRGGFTLIELAAVAVILGIAVTMFVLKMDGVTSSARLRAASRIVGSTIELALSNAVMKGKPRLVVYDARLGVIFIKGETKPDSWEPEILLERKLPKGVEITRVEGLFTSHDMSSVTVSQSGRTVPHAVYLHNDAGDMTVHVYGITGKVKYYEGDVSLAEFTKKSDEYGF